MSVNSRDRFWSVSLIAASLVACDDRSSEKKFMPAAIASIETANAVRVSIEASKKGFQPTHVQLTQGRPGILEFTRVDDTDCVSGVRMPWLDEPVDLPKGEKVAIAVDTSKAGMFRYACWMNMVFGRVTIDPAPE